MADSRLKHASKAADRQHCNTFHLRLHHNLKLKSAKDKNEKTRFVNMGKGRKKFCNSDSAYPTELYIFSVGL